MITLMVVVGLIIVIMSLFLFPKLEDGILYGALMTFLIIGGLTIAFIFLDKFTEKREIVAEQLIEQGKQIVIIGGKAEIYNVPIIKKKIVIDDGADLTYYELIKGE